MATDSGVRPAFDVLADAPEYRGRDNDPGLAEYVVTVDSLDTVPTTRAVREVGLFGNQNTVCQPTTPKWRHTVDRLKTYFSRWSVDA